MGQLQVNLKLESPVLLGTGEGWGSWIDTDIVFDRLGVPYVPARRFKGALRESALEVLEMLTCCGDRTFNMEDVKLIFGQPGAAAGDTATFSNLKLDNYDELSKWLTWALDKYHEIISAENILDTFTEIRQQTAINKEGTADENSLRTIRILKSNYTFTGQITFVSVQDKSKLLLSLACANLRRMGTNRTRGLGEVRCELWENGLALFPAALAVLKGVS